MKLISSASSRTLTGIFCLSAMLAVGHVQASVVFGNLGASGTGTLTNTNTDVGPSVTFLLAQGFTAASPNLTLNSVTLGLFGDGSIPASVDIYQDADGKPGMGPSDPGSGPLYSSDVVNVSTKNLYTFSFGATSLLTAGSTYWIVPKGDVSWYTTSSAPVQQNSSGYSFQQTLENTGTSWESAASNRYSVSVSAEPVPEPAAALLGGLGLLAFLRRKRD